MITLPTNFQIILPLHTVHKSKCSIRTPIIPFHTSVLQLELSGSHIAGSKNFRPRTPTAL